MANRAGLKIDWSLLHGMLIYDPSARYCAWKQGVSQDTLERHIKKEHNMTFAEYKALFVEDVAQQLKNIMINKAIAGDNTCLIFSLKNVSRWADRTEHGFSTNQEAIVLKYSLDQPKTGNSSGDGSK